MEEIIERNLKSIKNAIDVVFAWELFFKIFPVLGGLYYSALVLFKNIPSMSLLFSLIFLGALFYLMPAVSGKYIDLIYEREEQSLDVIFRNNCLNYYGVMFLVSLPVLFLIYFVGVKSQFSYLQVISGIAVSVLTIYSIPLVFIERACIKCISEGLYLLREKLSESVAIILIIVFVSLVDYFINVIGLVWLEKHTLAYALIGYCVFLLRMFLNMVVVVAATNVIKSILKSTYSG